jgi:hypothetical protein
VVALHLSGTGTVKINNFVNNNDRSKIPQIVAEMIEQKVI